MTEKGNVTFDDLKILQSIKALIPPSDDPNYLHTDEKGRDVFRPEGVNYNPLAENSENGDRSTEIMFVYKNERKRLDSAGDSRHIFFINAGVFIEGSPDFPKYSGNLTNGVLVVIDKDHKDRLNFLHSFDPRNRQTAFIKYTKKDEIREVQLKQNVSIWNIHNKINLESIPDSLTLRDHLMKKPKLNR